MSKTKSCSATAIGGPLQRAAATRNCAKPKQADLDLNPAISVVASRVIDGLLIAYMTKDDQISVEEKLITYEEGEFQPLLKRYSQNHSFFR